jgi:ketosteroid isomerase-like protein
MSADADVRHASAQFYTALNRMLKGDVGPLNEIWSHSATVTTMHPIGGRQVGWDQVRGSFEQVAGISSGGNVRLHDQIVHVTGDLAYEIGIERGEATVAGESVTIDDRVTNIYRREQGVWKLVHHHTDVAPSMIDVLKRLEGKH